MRTLPDMENLLQPLERPISNVLIPSLIGCNCSEAERDLEALPVRMGGLGLINPSDSADAEYSASIRVSSPLVSKIEAQSHETPEHYKPQARFSGDCDVQRRNLRIFLKGEAPSLLF